MSKGTGVDQQLGTRLGASALGLSPINAWGSSLGSAGPEEHGREEADREGL